LTRLLLLRGNLVGLADHLHRDPLALQLQFRARTTQIEEAVGVAEPGGRGDLIEDHARAVGHQQTRFAFGEPDDDALAAVVAIDRVLRGVDFFLRWTAALARGCQNSYRQRRQPLCESHRSFVEARCGARISLTRHQRATGSAWGAAAVESGSTADRRALRSSHRRRRRAAFFAT